ncbi:MAG: DUF2336 domain-containing protein [Rhodospirillaceae bacterium]|nr:DUF2336 domain-containing protein [Rhodospirillaceae bacterium]
MARQGRDIQALVQMALDTSSSSRNALAQSVVDIYLDDDATLSERETQLTFDILHKLLQSVELGVRRGLAQRLAYRPDVPRDLVVSLANDEINVAYPVLVESVVLEDADLIAIAHNQPASHQIAVTLRERISPDVSDALIESRNVDVIDSLLRNPAAEIAVVALERLVELSRDTPPLQRPLLQRHDMQPELARQMSAWVGDALKEYIATNFPDAIEQVELDIDEAVRKVSEGSAFDPETDARVAQIESGGGITADALIEALSCLKRCSHGLSGSTRSRCRLWFTIRVESLSRSRRCFGRLQADQHLLRKDRRWRGAAPDRRLATSTRRHVGYRVTPLKSRQK